MNLGLRHTQQNLFYGIGTESRPPANINSKKKRRKETSGKTHISKVSWILNTDYCKPSVAAITSSSPSENSAIKCTSRILEIKNGNTVFVDQPERPVNPQTDRLHSVFYQLLGQSKESKWLWFACQSTRKDLAVLAVGCCQYQFCLIKLHP